jgi:hypothetical protein
VRLLTSALGGFLVLSIAFVTYFSRDWHISQDSKLIHYVVFLMRHGYVPYRDIVEINLPGSYLMEWVGMKFFGPGNIGWRFYDLFLTAISAVAAWRIARPRGQRASFAAAALVVLYHLGRGDSEAGQRDFEMTVLLMIGFAAFFSSVRVKRSWLMAVFGACCGLAVGIKPFVILLPFVAMAVLYFEMRAEKENISRPPGFAAYLAWAMTGALLPAAALAGFLWRNHLWREFYQQVSVIALYHRGVGNEPWSVLCVSWLQWFFAPLVLVGLYAGWRLWPQWDWEEKIIAGLAAFGLATYIYQGKGWTYHAALLWAFLLIGIVRMVAGWIDLPQQMKSWRGAFAASTVALTVLLPATYIPISAHRHPPREDVWVDTLTADLNDLGGAANSGRIQCLDWNAGCIDALYTQRWLPATGFIYDYFLFPPSETPTAELEQARFLGMVQAAPPRVIVLSSLDWPVFTGFRKLDRWPVFRDWLNEHYRLTVERQINDRAYRIYVAQ